MSDINGLLLPTAYFPPVSWFVYLLSGKSVIIEQMETFHKQTYRNRCEIMTAAGMAALVVPVTKPQGNHTMTGNVEICYHEPWRELHWKTLQTSYSSSPFFSYYADNIRSLFESRERLLIRQNHEILIVISNLIGIELNISFTRDYDKNPINIIDMRNEISPKKRQASINFPEYPQVFKHLSGFIPDLSILDLLFNLGPEAGHYIMKVGR